MVASANHARPIEAFVYAPFRVDDLLTAALGQQIDTIGGIELRAGEGPSAPRAFQRGRIGWDAHERRLHVADRLWGMRSSFGLLIDPIARPLAILFFGASLTSLVTEPHNLSPTRHA